jgi:hypothetical protein
MSVHDKLGLTVRGVMTLCTLILSVAVHPAWLLLTAWVAMGSLRKEPVQGQRGMSVKALVDLGVTTSMMIGLAVLR